MNTKYHEGTDAQEWQSDRDRNNKDSMVNNKYLCQNQKQNHNNRNRLPTSDANVTIELTGATARAATESQPNPPPAAETYAMEKDLEEQEGVLGAS